MWKSLSFLTLLFLVSCGSDEPKFHWDSQAKAFFYDGKKGKISVQFGMESAEAPFALAEKPKSEREGINTLKIKVSRTLGTTPPKVVIKGLSCCSGNPHGKTLTLTKDASQPDSKVISYSSQRFHALEDGKPPYSILVSIGNLEDLLLEL